ncbi:MAG: ABC transporter permease [Muribaculaceae bacterium]|nr:ABC transporter permease [Muribaculaceae bacterium]
MFDLFREISQTIRTNKLRTALTGLSVAWGIFMLIVLLGISTGIINAFDRNMMHRDNNYIRFYGGITSKAHEGYKEGREIQLKEEDGRLVHNDDKWRISGVKPTLSNDTAVFVYGSNIISGGYNGTMPEQAATRGLKIIEGRFLNAADLNEMRKVMVISKGNAETVFGSAKDAVGKVVNAGGMAWTIIGVYDHRFERTTYVPFTTGMALQGYNGNVAMLTVDVQNISTIEEGEDVEKNVRQVLAQKHDFAPDDDNALWYHNGFTQGLQAKSGMAILDWTMWVIGLLSLFSGIVGVGNIMFVSVKERTHEIGIRRAIGAKPRSVLIQVVAESVVITTLFGYIGIVMATVFMAVVSHIIGDSMQFLSNPTVDFKVAIAVTIILIISGALAGLFPAIQATKVSPVEALRDE